MELTVFKIHDMTEKGNVCVVLIGQKEVKTKYGVQTENILAQAIFKGEPEGLAEGSVISGDELTLIPRQDNPGQYRAYFK